MYKLISVGYLGYSECLGQRKLMDIWIALAHMYWEKHDVRRTHDVIMVPVFINL